MKCHALFTISPSQMAAVGWTGIGVVRLWLDDRNDRQCDL